MARSLPDNPNLDQLRTQAKELRKLFASADRAAIDRFTDSHPKFADAAAAELESAEVTLADAQLVIAREYGFATWAKLKSHIETLDEVDLHELVTGEDLAAIRAGVEQDGDSLNRRNSAGLPPLYIAALYSNRAAVQLLLELGAEVDIFAAAYLGRTDDGRRLLDQDSSLVRATTRGSITPLHYAARAGHADVAQLLLEAGADPNSRDKDGRTPLHEACHGGPWKPGVCEPVVELLLKHNADVDLHTAAGMGRADLVATLLDREPNAIDQLNKREQTPLFVAAHNNRLETVKLLIERGADVNAADAVGAAALHRISQQCTDELIQYLIDHGADAHLCCHVACGNIDGVRRCLEQDAASLHDELYGFAAIAYAIHCWQLGSLRLLLKAGGQLNDEDKQHILRISQGDKALLTELQALSGNADG